MDPKWIIIQPLKGTGQDIHIPPVTEAWSPNPFRNLARLLQCKQYHIEDTNIDMTGDIYYFINFDCELFEKEIALMKVLKELNKKIIYAFSQDMRFLIGNGLMNSRGTLYSEICELADVIFGGTSQECNIFGRYSDKVLYLGECIEDLNYSQLDKSIDLLMSGSVGEETIPFALEIGLSIKKKYPSHRVVYALHSNYDRVSILRDKFPEIEFITTMPLIELMKMSKVYINPELRPRPGRAIIEAFYCRVPCVCSSFTYHSRLFARHNYSCMDIPYIIHQYIRLQSESELAIKYAEIMATYDHKENWFNRVYSKLGENNEIKSV